MQISGESLQRHLIIIYLGLASLLTLHKSMDSFLGRGNRGILLVKVLYCFVVWY